MSTQIKNVLKTDSKAYGVSRINIYCGSLFKVVHCTTKHLLHSLNVRRWPPGTCCHPHGREEEAGGTFPSLHVHELAKKSKLVMLRCSYTQHPAQGQLLPLWWDFLWTSGRSGRSRGQGQQVLSTVLCFQSGCRVVCTSWTFHPHQTAAALGGLGTPGSLELPLGHTSGLLLVNGRHVALLKCFSQCFE